MKYIFIVFLIMSCTEKKHNNKSNDFEIYEKTTDQDPETLRYEDPTIQQLNIYNRELEFEEVDHYTFSIDLSEIKATLSKPVGNNDPGDFHKIRLSINDINILTIENIDGWISLNNSQQAKNYTMEVLVNKHIMIAEHDKNIYLILKGYSYANSPGLLTIIKANNSKAEVVYNDNVLLKDLNIDVDNKFYIVVSDDISGNKQKSIKI